MTDIPRWTLRECERFWSKVTITKDCWIWTGQTRGHQNRASFNFRGRPYSAARFLWLQVVGFLEEDQKVLHHCDNPSCVRPIHLFSGTQLDNVHDALQKKRHPSRGYLNPIAKLLPGEVDEIRDRFSRGENTREILQDFPQVKLGTIQRICYNRGWEHVRG